MPANRPFRARPLPGDVAFDDADLARRARTTLAGADVGVLVTGVRTSCTPGSTLVRVLDDDGEALIICRPDDPIARAARARRLANLVLAPTPSAGVRLRLSGRLNSVEDAPGESMATSHVLAHAKDAARSTGDAIVVLRVDRVDAGCPHPHSYALGGSEQNVPLPLYALAQPDLLAANLPRMIAYLNCHHAEQLRWLAADTIGQPLNLVAAASLTALTPSSAALCWIDDVGAHDTERRFLEPATTLEELARTIRTCIRDAATNLGHITS
jgi:hypothetical protein